MTTTKRGFREDLMLLRSLSEIMEQHPGIPRPSVSFGSYTGTAHIGWYLSADWNTTAPDIEDAPEELNWDGRWAWREEQIKTRRRQDLEARIATIIDALEAIEPVTEWQKNDPTEDQWTYQLKAEWRGASVTVSTSRSEVCEKVIVLQTERVEEQPDPEWLEKVTSAAPKVKVTVKDTVSEWQCNSALAEKTAPKYAVTTKSEVS